MTLPWGFRGDDDRDRQTGSASDDLAMIPRWSVVLAVVAFGLMQYLFHGVLPHHKHEMLPMRLLMGYSWGTLVASYVLLVGYVSRDVKRRKMPAALWMLIVIMMPGWHWRSGVLSAAAAAAFTVSALLDGDLLQLSLLPAVPVPGGAGVRTVLPRGRDYRRVLPSSVGMTWRRIMCRLV